MDALERAMLYGITNFSGIALIAIMLISRRNTSLKTSEKIYFNDGKIDYSKTIKHLKNVHLYNQLLFQIMLFQ